jgi:hypothetical protein
MERDETTQLARIASAALNEAERSATLPNEAVDEALTLLKSRGDTAEQFNGSLFPGGIPLDGSFYARLYRVAAIVGFDDGGTEFVGHVWSAALLTLAEPDREKLLRSLPTGHEFFVILRSLPFVLKRCRFEPPFLIDTLIEIRTRIGNDMAQGGYWRGIEAWAAAFPEDAFHGFEFLLDRNLDDDGISIAAAILGSLRVAWELGTGSPSDHAASEQLARESAIKKRLIYHRSWINTGWIRGISDVEFRDHLRLMSEGSEEEQGEAFNFVRCLVADGRTSQSSLDFAVEWLNRTANATLPDNLKHWGANVAHTLARRWILDRNRLESLLPAWLAVHPIAFDNKGAWMEIEHLLVELLQKHPSQFERWLLALLEVNPAGVIRHFRGHGRFEYLCSEIVTHGAAHIASSLFFSTSEHQRQFAFTLYDKVPFDSFPDGMLAARSDNEIALCLFESRRHFLEPEHTARFLIAFHQRTETASPQLAKLFRDELLYQAKNLPRAVLGALKGVGNSQLVQDVVKDAEAYFDKLQTTHRSAINSMEIPGWKRALFIRSRRQSREMEQHKNDFSVLSQLFTTSYLIYGNQGFRSSHDGEIAEFAPMKSVSVSMEAPRLAMIDPEGAFARNVEAGRACQRLAEALVTDSANQQ